MKEFDPKQNYKFTREQTGYVTIKEATPETYRLVGFKSGLEVHQQLLTEEKLFCHCPARIYNHNDDYDAELTRHMRPTLSELGEYDGTALMEFKTKKEILYRVKNETACTYEVDDTPPFPMNREALDIAVEISLLSKLNIVGEVHISRKQYLDGSIPTGFQRTAIVGVEGEIELPYKKIRLIQLSIEEDACREISDIGHQRVFKTDRLGMPLIETVTYPDCSTPEEVRDACNVIRFLNRSTGKVRTGMGAGRQDVNVSCRNGARVEIKGVSHTKWIPELTHNEVFRQWALLKIKKILNRSKKVRADWKIKTIFNPQIEIPQVLPGEKSVLINLPHFKGILSHYTQPGKMFADEISGRLKVIACLEEPFMTHSETFDPIVSRKSWDQAISKLEADQNDAQIIIWGKEIDLPTAIETVEERCRMAFEGVPNETRKSFPDGTTIFERVLPGANRMYPDTDSIPIPLEDDYIEKHKSLLPKDFIYNYNYLLKWKIPEDTYTYIFSKNLFPLIHDIVKKLGANPKYISTFIGHELKFAEGHYNLSKHFKYARLFDLFEFLKKEKLEFQLAEKILPELIEHPRMDFESMLTSIGFKRTERGPLLGRIPFLIEKLNKSGNHGEKQQKINQIMGHLRSVALGNINLTELSRSIGSQIN